MQFQIIAFNFLYAALGVALMFLSYKVIDWLTPGIRFPEELAKGNIAVGIVMASIFIAISLIISRSLN